MQARIFKDEDLLCTYDCLSPESLFAMIDNTLVLSHFSLFSANWNCVMALLARSTIFIVICHALIRVESHCVDVAVCFDQHTSFQLLAFVRLCR